jgi:hypothetical protein
MRPEDAEEIRPVASLQEFFKDSVAGAMARQRVDADDHTAYYVVNLLTLFARSEALFDQTENGTELKPLAKVLAESIETERAAERHYALQRVGDVALFVAGFLGDGLARRPVDVDYYVRMGAAAYSSLSISVRGSLRGQVFAAVFAELGNKFRDFVDVLNEVKVEAGSEKDIDVLRMYEVWLRTGSARAAQALRRQGIEPQRAASIHTRH